MRLPQGKDKCPTRLGEPRGDCRRREAGMQSACPSSQWWSLILSLFSVMLLAGQKRPMQVIYRIHLLPSGDCE